MTDIYIHTVDIALLHMITLRLTGHLHICFHAFISQTDCLDYLNSYHGCGLASLTYIHETSSGQRARTPTERLDIK